MPVVLRPLPFLMCLLMLTLAACAPRSSGRASESSGPAVVPAEFVDMLVRVNEVRAVGYDCGAEGRFGAAGPLVWNARLAQAALDHSRDMLEHNRFSHTGSDGSSPSVRAVRRGYDWQLVGENLAYATPGHFDARSVVDAWLGSPGHCANLLEPEFREMGAARVTGDLEFWTQVFGTPR